MFVNLTLPTQDIDREQAVPAAQIVKARKQSGRSQGKPSDRGGRAFNVMAGFPTTSGVRLLLGFGAGPQPGRPLGTSGNWNLGPTIITPRPCGSVSKEPRFDLPDPCAPAGVAWH